MTEEDLERLAARIAEAVEKAVASALETRSRGAWLTTAEAAARCRLSPSRFRELVLACHIPYGGSQKRRLFDQEIVDAFIRRGFNRLEVTVAPQRRRARAGGVPSLEQVRAQLKERLKKEREQERARR